MNKSSEYSYGAHVADRYVYVPVKGRIRLFLVKRWAQHRKVKYILWE